MKKNIQYLILTPISLVIGFLIHRAIVADLITTFMPAVSMYNSVHIGAIFIESGLVFLVVTGIINKNISKSSIYLMWACYFIILGFLLFARKFGLNGMNLNPFAFIQDLRNDPQSLIIIFMNIFLFIPMGYLFKNKKNTFSIVIMFLILLSIETIQYTLKLGIFDIDDIILNFIGFLIGYKIIGKYLIIIRI